MRDSMYSAAFGAMAAEHRLNMVANNLANVNTTGYKKDSLAFHDTFLRFAHDYMIDSKPFLRDKEMWPTPQVKARPRLSSQQTDFMQGHLEVTGNPLDLGLQGEGFFKVRTPQGDFFTRNGRFTVNAEGVLVNEEGFTVLAQGGPLQVPMGAQVTVDASGMLRDKDQEFGRLDVVTVDNPKNLEKIGKNLYQAKKGKEVAETPITRDTAVTQGFLEKANVEVVEEMVSLIEVQRGFELYQKMITTTSDLDQKAIDQVGRATG